jgi:hypothetical protein
MSCVRLYVVKCEASLLFYLSEMLVCKYLTVLLACERVGLQQGTARALTAVLCAVA